MKVSKRVVEKSKESEEMLHKAEQMKLATTEDNVILKQHREYLENEWLKIDNQVEAVNHCKMELARQRVGFLKEKYLYRQQFN